MTVTLVKKLTAGLVLAVVIVNGSGSALAQKKVAGSQITSFDPQGAGTVAGQGTFPQQGLNSGDIVGYYIDADAVAHGFIRTVDGKYTIIDVPGAVGTQAFGINDKGTVVGWWFEAPTAKGSVYHGYLRDKDGNLTTFEVPGAGPYQPQVTSPIVIIPLPLSINRDGTVAGSYVDVNNMNHGFVRSVNEKITSFDPPGSVSTVGDTNGINRTGAVTGGYLTADGVTHAYLRDPEGAITSFNAPDAGTLAGQGSYFNMINDAGLIPGVIIDQHFVQHGFLLSRDGTLVKVEVPGAGTGQYQGTLASAANVSGIAGGNYFDANGVSHGFVRSRHGITHFDVPGEGTGSGQGLTAVNSINEEGAVVGWYIDGNGAYHGYIYQYRGEDESNVPEADILKEPSGIVFGSTASACYPLGHYCKSGSQCCSNLCGSGNGRRCCDKLGRGQICTSNAECCFGACITVGTNHMCSLGL